MSLIPIYTWNKSILAINKRSKRLSRQPWFQGVLLLACVILAMLLANLPLTSHYYHSLLETEIQVHFASPNGTVDFMFPKDMTVEKFINDILMVIFFFTVGLEIKREIAHGELSSVKKALLPVIAAFGGVVMPAVIFTLVNHGTAAASGWGIPTATDIAFAVCILTVLSDKVPVSLKVFLTALAIADDLIAILVVAFFYGGKINLVLLSVALAVILLTLLLRKLGEKRMFPYVFLSVVVWILFYPNSNDLFGFQFLNVMLPPVASMVPQAQPLHCEDRQLRRHRRRALPERPAEALPAQAPEYRPGLNGHELSRGAFPGPMGQLPHHAGVRPGQCRGTDQGPFHVQCIHFRS